MIDEILNFLLGLVDDTYDNDVEPNEKLREIERTKIKKLKRK